MSEAMARSDVMASVAAVDGRAVLVAGQAVAWWTEFYAAQGRLPELGQASAMYVSKDADFVPGSLKPEALMPLVRDVASRLRGRTTSHPFHSLVVRSVTYVDEAGASRRVEFLKGLHGVKSRAELVEGAVEFEAAQGLPSCLVMHPVMLLESRIANVSDLDAYQTEKAVAQARFSLAVAREWHLDQLAVGWAPARRGLERTVALAESRRGITVAARHGLRALDAVPAGHPALPAPFVQQRLRRCREKVEVAIEAARSS